MENNFVPAFYFELVYKGEAISFMEISGIATILNVEEVTNGGENRFTYHLPIHPTCKHLVCKRAIDTGSSPISAWCRDSINNGLDNPIETSDILVNLLDASGNAALCCVFYNAYPVTYSLSDLHSMENRLVIETIELAYEYFQVSTTPPVMSNPVEPESMTITGYTDAACTKPIKGGPYSLMINPSTINWTRNPGYSDNPSNSTVHKPGQLIAMPAENISFEITIDCTGIVDKDRTDMSVEMDALKRNIFESDSSMPKYVKIAWGKEIDFSGLLTTFDTDYTLFSRNGTPLRAKILLAFSRYYLPAKKIRKK